MTWTKGWLRALAAVLMGAALVGCSSTPPQSDSGTQAGGAVGGVDVDTGTISDEGALSGKALQAKIAEMREHRVHFDFDRSEIKSEYFGVIQEHADFMAANPNLKVTIAGYCDERGSPEYNLALGERRANAVYNALVAQGISPKRIQTVSYGENYPLDPRHNEDAWAKNRRATFVYGIGEFVRPH